MIHDKKFNGPVVAIYLVSLLFAMFNILQIDISGFSRALPMLDIMAIYYFGVFNPIFSVWFIFIMGVFADALNSNPLGLSSVVYILLVRLFLIANKRLVIRENFIQILQQFAAFVTLSLLLKWIILSLYYESFYNISILLVQLIITSVFYVPIHKLFDFLIKKTFSR